MLFPDVVTIEFYVANICFETLIGISALRDPKLMLNFVSKYNVLNIGATEYQLSPSVDLAIKQLQLRKEQCSQNVLTMYDSS